MHTLFSCGIQWPDWPETDFTQEKSHFYNFITTRMPNSSFLLAVALSKMVGHRYSRGVKGMKNAFETPGQ